MKPRATPRALAAGAATAVLALVAALTFSVTAAGAQSGGPVGYLDSVSVDGNTVSVRGWAADPGQPERDVLVDAYVDGDYVRTGVTNRTRSDVVAVHPTFKSTTGFAMDFGVATGNREICVYATDQSALNTLLGCATVEAGTDATSPAGFLDGVSVDGTTITARGWAADPGQPERDVLVDLYVNGTYTQTTTTDVTRGDVEAAFPAYGSQTGFVGSFGASPGDKTVCAYAIDQDALNTLLGCRNVTVETTDATMPVGFLDRVSVEGTTVTAAGWAADPGMPDRVVNVDIFVSGSYATTTTNELARPDVEAAFPAYSSATGFRTTFGVSPGGHQVCAYAIDQDALNTLLGCRVITVEGAPGQAPVGYLDVVSAVDGGVRVGGWAADPGQPDRDVLVDVYFNGVYAATTAADGPRPDVSAAFPAYGDTGFDAIVEAPAGTHRVCVFAVDADALNTRLGCAVVTVSA